MLYTYVCVSCMYIILYIYNLYVDTQNDYDLLIEKSEILRESFFFVGKKNHRILKKFYRNLKNFF